MVAAAAAQYGSSYRVKFRRKEFIELVDIDKPNIIHKRERPPLTPKLLQVSNLLGKNRVRYNRH